MSEDVSNIAKMLKRILLLVPSRELNTSTLIKQEYMLVVTLELATPINSVRTDYSGTNGLRENVGL